LALAISCSGLRFGGDRHQVREIGESDIVARIRIEIPPNFFLGVLSEWVPSVQELSY